MFNEEKYSDLFENDELARRLQGLENSVCAPTELTDAVIAGMPYSSRGIVSVSTHVKRFSGAILAYVLGVVLLLGSIFVVSHLLDGRGGPIASHSTHTTTATPGTTTSQTPDRTDPTITTSQTPDASQTEPETKPEPQVEALSFTPVNGGYAVSGIGSYQKSAVVIPAEYNGKPVVAIGKGAFQNCTTMTSIVIPDTVSSIGEMAFSGCSKLGTVRLPDAVTVLADETFRGCRQLSAVTLPKNLTSIGEMAFGECWKLKNITLPDTLKTIKAGAFWDCQGLTELSIPDGVTLIGDVFSGCVALQSVRLPAQLEYITPDLFSDCTALREITIPDTVTMIGASAFSGCKNLERIVIPESVVYIDVNAFGRCAKLREVVFEHTEGWGVDVTDPAANADLLTDTYVMAVWQRYPIG